MALKRVGSVKSAGLDGLPHELYLSLSHIFVPILTVVFSNWFQQGFIVDGISMSVIRLLKKNLADYYPITLPNTVLKISNKILMECLQSGTEILSGVEKNCVVKGRTIQSKLHLMHTVLEGVKNDVQAALINLDLSIG